MTFRQDINALRAIAVLVVVIFHFNPDWLPGGFIGVDVFFVISGFLMTGIIFRGFEKETFRLGAFYLARAHRIIPALLVLCLALLCFGWLYLPPPDYQVLGTHIASSLSFLSNITYLSEAGYFDSDAHDKWLLHTWSLSVEWQFYLIYPIILLGLKQWLSLHAIKRVVLISTVLIFIANIVVSQKWTEASYYLLPTRSWEMLLGGIAYFYPLSLTKQQKTLWLYTGLSVIFLSSLFISPEDVWPGYMALFPVMGAYAVITAHHPTAVFTHHPLLHYLGKCSYSIYLWHWPVVVWGVYFEFDQSYWWLIGIPVSVLFGHLSYTYIETATWLTPKRTPPALPSTTSASSKAHLAFDGWQIMKSIVSLKYVWVGGAVFLSSYFIATHHGIPQRYSEAYLDLIAQTQHSPYREQCHLKKYQAPDKACEYFDPNVSWAIIGDSHAVELAYALADKLQPLQQGVKHFSYSACRPSYNQAHAFSHCATWYNDSLNYIIANDDIKHVVFNHRYSRYFFGDNAATYPNTSAPFITDDVDAILQSIDDAILTLSKHKETVYVFYPIPELGKHIKSLIEVSYRQNHSIEAIPGTSLQYYQQRNAYIIEHFDSATYPANVHFIKPSDAFCDQDVCFSVKDSTALYYDDDHPSLKGANLLVDLLLSANNR